MTTLNNYDSCMKTISEDFLSAMEERNMSKWDLILKGRKSQHFVECTLMGIDHDNQLTIRELCSLADVLGKKVVVTLEGK